MIIIVGLLVVVIGFILGKLGVHLMQIMLICGTAGGFFGQKMFGYLDKRIN